MILFTMKVKSLFIFIITLAILFVPVFVANAQYGIDVTAGKTPVKDFMNVSLQGMMGNLIGGVLSLVGILFFALMVYGGIIWMSAAGNQEREKKAGGIMIGAVIGIIIALSSYTLVSFVFDYSGGVEETSTPTTPVIQQECKVKTDLEIQKYCDSCQKGDECNLEDDDCITFCYVKLKKCISLGQEVAKATCDTHKTSKSLCEITGVCEWK